MDGNMDWRKPTRLVAALVPRMRVMVSELLRILTEQGIQVLTLDTYRDPWTQARLWRQSRLRSQIESHVAELERRGYPQLGAILDSVGPQQGEIGNHVTQAGPGESWHQYGMAMDLVPRYDSKRLLWDVPLGRGTAESEHASDLWDIVGAAAHQVGLEWGGSWPTPDRMHVQLPAVASPLFDKMLVAETAVVKHWYDLPAGMSTDESCSASPR